MAISKWDNYFNTHYHPLDGKWGKKDLDKYRKWYYMWIKFIYSKCNKLDTPQNIFEIGSGIGSVSKLLNDLGHNVIGSDISNLMVNEANRIAKPVKFKYFDAVKSKFDKKYDIVIAFEVLEHIKEVDTALTNIFNGLNNKGIFIATTPYPYPKNFIDPTHVNVQYPKYWQEKLIKNGFSKVELRSMSFLPYLWKINKNLNFVIPYPISYPYIVSTTLLFCYK